MINELRIKSNKELGQLVVKMKSKLLEYRFRDASGELDGSHKIKMVKKTIAIALTILSERNIKLSLSSNDHALIEIQDGKRVITSFKEKGSNSIIFEEDSPTKVVEEVKDKKVKVSKNLKTQSSTTSEKKAVEKKITITTDKSKSSKSNYGNIRKSTGRGQ